MNLNIPGLKRFKSEWKVFKRLPINTRRFFGASLTYNFYDSLVFTFAYAYMFSQTNSFIAVAIFNVIFYITLLTGFFVNLRLLRYFGAKRLFILSSILQALSLFSVFYVPEISLLAIGIVGGFCGFFQGIYWSVRNSVYLSFTTDENRHYFEGLKSTLGTTTDMMLLAVAGWFIAKSQLISFFTKIEAYRIVGLGGVVILILGTLFLLKTEFPTITISHYRPKSVSPQWKLFRGFVLASAVQFALVISVPETMILHFLGDESILGSMQAIFVVLSAMCLYILGRKSHKGHRSAILFASAIPLIVLSFALTVSQHPILIVSYLLFMYVSNQLFWFVYFPIFSRAIEYETTDTSKQYAFVLDHEILINGSRIVMTIAYILLVQRLGDVQGMFIALIVGALMQVLTALIGRPLLAMQNSTSKH